MTCYHPISCVTRTPRLSQYTSGQQQTSKAGNSRVLLSNQSSSFLHEHPCPAIPPILHRHLHLQAWLPSGTATTAQALQALPPLTQHDPPASS
jgi:hypothetical protein